ncbi:hypothetical protein [Endozoicomonas sp.]|uniref:hypothetical protein n=1 Tax=Endozoicomonas sp. TaxID=1892382 RepID=UPI003AF9F829
MPPKIRGCAPDARDEEKRTGHTLVKGSVIPVNVSTTSQKRPINASPHFASGQHTDADCYIVTALSLK